MLKAAPYLQPDSRRPRNPRQRLWRVLRHCHTPRDIGELFVAADIEPELFHSLIGLWSTRGLITQPAPMRFLMTDDARKRKRPPPATTNGRKLSVPKFSGRQRMWSAIRVLKFFDMPQLVMTAGVTTRSAGDYVRQLTATGYLDPVPTAMRTKFRLARNTGPKHPITRARVEDRTSIIQADDRNDGKLYEYRLDFGTPGVRASDAILRTDDGGVS